MKKIHLHLLLVLWTVLLLWPMTTMQPRSFFKKVFKAVRNPIAKTLVKRTIKPPVTALTNFNRRNVQVVQQTAEHIVDINLDNFHTVQKGNFYRCKQLSAEKLEGYVEKYSIKTIINLRGENDTDWWHQERELVDKLGIHMINIHMSAQSLPSKENVEQALHAFDTAERPILTHCQAGADRTGLVSALWVLDQQKKDKSRAKAQLSIFSGHVSYQYPSMKKFINMWQGRDWVLNEYNPKF